MQTSETPQDCPIPKAYAAFANLARPSAEQSAQQGIKLYAKGGDAKLLSLDLWPLKSVWETTL